MINRFRKTKISIESIGRQRFWIGLATGVTTAIIISLFFNYSREVLRSMTGSSADLLILKGNELQFSNYFFSTLASVLGLSITLWMWMQNKEHNRRKDGIYKGLSASNALVIFWIMLFAVSRFGSILPLILFGTPGYDNHLNFYEDIWILLVLIPLVVFLQSWSTIRIVYRAGRWMMVSFLICILMTFTLQMFTSVNQEKLNRAYNHKYASDYQFIDKEIKTAKVEYGIEFDTQTIDILKKWYTESSVEQMKLVKKAFTEDKPVSLDTIILQKIIIRNYKQGVRTHLRNSLDNWHYALPQDILRQLNYFNPDSNQAKELIKIIKEQIELVNTPDINWEESKKYTETEKRRSRGARYLIPGSLKKQLKEIRISLLEDKRYNGLIKELPVIREPDYNN